MPLFAEIGPIMLDPNMEQELEQSFKDLTEKPDFLKQPKLLLE